MDPVCRVCMSGSITLVDLFAKRKQLDTEPSLSEMLNECVDCDVKQDDPLPKQICLNCVLETQNAFRFKRRCEHNYKLFWEMFSEDKAICELFETDDWTIPECNLELDCVKKEPLDATEKESSKVTLLENLLQPSEPIIDISCVKKEKLDSPEEEILPDNPPHISKNLEEALLPKIKLDNQKKSIDNSSSSSSSSKATEGVFINTSTIVNRNTHICKTCNQGFSNMTLLAKHTIEHKVQGCLFKCSQCPKTCSKRSEIELHMHVHSTNSRPFKCNHCPKAFYRRSELHTHINVHSGERPYVCPHCSQSFNHPSNLQRHIKTHSDKPPYKCSQCPKAFLKKQDAVEHILTHKEVRPFKCPHCNSSFRNHACRPAHERGKFTKI